MADQEQPRELLGHLLDAAGVTGYVPDHVLVSGALVLFELSWPDGTTSLYQSHSDGMNFIKRLGMLTVATTIENGGYSMHEGDLG